MSEHLIINVGDRKQLWFQIDDRSASELAADIVETFGGTSIVYLCWNIRIFESEEE